MSRRVGERCERTERARAQGRQRELGLGFGLGLGLTWRSRNALR